MDEKNQQTPAASSWERQVLERLANDILREQRARRRWGIFFKLVGMAWLIGLATIAIDWQSPEKLADRRHTAVVNLRGIIDGKGEASADNVISALQSAFADKRTAGVILRINSPGGSPVQSGIIYDEIRRLRAKYPQTPLHAVVDDLCASGGYYVAAASEQIHVNRASLIGSIGVLMNGFGFTGSMEKLGIERRMLTAGANKGFLDPFSPQEEGQKAHAQRLLDDIHAQFIDAVRSGRGERLQDRPEIFSGLVWTGAQSIELGLADAFGTVDSVAREVFQTEKTVDYSVRENLAERFAKRLGADVFERLALHWGGFSLR